MTAALTMQEWPGAAALRLGMVTASHDGYFGNKKWIQKNRYGALLPAI
jgi:hypothetical protein